MMKSLVSWSIALLALQALLGVTQAAESPWPATQAIAEATLAGTVGIRCQGEDAFMGCMGTGVVVSPTGHILTATSVVPAGAKKIRVTFPGFVVRDAQIVAVDEKLSVALIKVDTEENLPFLTLARQLPAVGTTAYTASDVENALQVNGRASFSRGLVSGVYEVPRHHEATYEGLAIETTAAVNPGSDGGPLVDATGFVCGIITLGTLPLRWQGTAVPTTVLLERFTPFASGGILPPAAAPGAAGQQPGADPLRATAAEIAEHLVGIEVERQFPPEALPRPTWPEFRAGIKEFEKLAEPQRNQRFMEYLNLARALEVNQLLRRPAAPVTGLVVSADGFVLTSLFNVGGDTAFVRKSNGTPREIDVHQPIQKLLGEQDSQLEQRPNAIKKVTVVRRDGSRHEATVVSRHEPLGVALLKIEARDLPWYDVAGNATSPQLGDGVALVGYLPGAAAGFTINTGIVSAPARNRGYQFQTDALVNYGNSGGPVVDRAGNFLGLAAAPIQPDTLLGRLVSPQQLMMWSRAPNSGVGMAARGDRIRDALEAMQAGKSFERVPGPFLGVMADESKAFGDSIVVGGVAPGSPAEKAGLKRGDVVVELNGEELRSWPDLVERVSACKAGETVGLKIQRRGMGPRLVIAGRDVETADDLQKLKKSLTPGQTFEGVLSTDDTRIIQVTLGENK
jgi:S1-C subfamily serine protease